jgi:hypothetical protein
MCTSEELLIPPGSSSSSSSYCSIQELLVAMLSAQPLSQAVAAVAAALFAQTCDTYR